MKERNQLATCIEIKTLNKTQVKEETWYLTSGEAEKEGFRHVVIMVLPPLCCEVLGFALLHMLALFEGSPYTQDAVSEPTLGKGDGMTLTALLG